MCRALRYGWNRRRKRLARPQPEAFPTGKPERTIPSVVMWKEQGSASLCSELVLYPWLSRLSRSFQEEIVRVEDPVAQVLISLPVEEICPALRAQVGHSAGASAPFRSQVAGLHFELLN